MKILTHLLTFIILLLAFVACEREQEVLDEELYKTIMTELAIVNQMDENLLNEKSRDEKREEIFSHYGVSEDFFDQSHEYYQNDIDAQMQRVRDVQDRLRAERDSVQAAERRHREENRLDPDSIRQQIRDRRLEQP